MTSFKRTFSKDWCKGFCRTCGTGCGEYCEDIHELREENVRLREALEWYAGWVGPDKDIVSKYAREALNPTVYTPPSTVNLASETKGER